MKNPFKRLASNIKNVSKIYNDPRLYEILNPEKGICHGLTLCWGQAVLLNDKKTFYDRFFFLVSDWSKISLEELKKLLATYNVYTFLYVLLFYQSPSLTFPKRFDRQNFEVSKYLLPDNLYTFSQREAQKQRGLSNEDSFHCLYNGCFFIAREKNKKSFNPINCLVNDFFHELFTLISQMGNYIPIVTVVSTHSHTIGLEISRDNENTYIKAFDQNFIINVVKDKIDEIFISFSNLRRDLIASMILCFFSFGFFEKEGTLCFLKATVLTAPLYKNYHRAIEISKRLKERFPQKKAFELHKSNFKSLYENGPINDYTVSNFLSFLIRNCSEEIDLSFLTTEDIKLDEYLCKYLLIAGQTELIKKLNFEIIWILKGACISGDEAFFRYILYGPEEFYNIYVYEGFKNFFNVICEYGRVEFAKITLNLPWAALYKDAKKIAHRHGHYHLEDTLKSMEICPNCTGKCDPFTTHNKCRNCLKFFCSNCLSQKKQTIKMNYASYTINLCNRCDIFSNRPIPPKLNYKKLFSHVT